MQRRSCLPLFLIGLLTLALLAGAVSCNKARDLYHKGMAELQGQQYGPALEDFEASLALDPTSNMALFGKARCLYELRRFDEALPCFEQFLTQTELDRATYGDQRFDAEFYRDKCKQELGQEVPQNKDAIPEERMRY